MKNLRFFKTLLIAIGLLAMSVNQMWAGTKKVYMVANAWNDDSNAEFWVHAWDGDDEHVTDAKMNLMDNESEIYSADVADTNDKYIFVRRNKNDGGSAPWSGEWNRAEFKSSNSYNCFHVKAFNDYEMNTNLTTATVYFASSATNVWVNVNRQVNSKDLWSLVPMTSTGKTYDGTALYSATFNMVWGGLGVLQFKEDDSWGSNIINSSTITSSSTFAGKFYNGSSWVAYSCDQNVTVSSDANGSVDSEGTVLLYASGTTLTATPTNSNTHKFKDWLISGGGISPSSSSTNPQAFTATSDGGTIQARFESKWALVGSMNSWNDGTNRLGSYATESSKLKGSVSVTLNANTQYSFKIKDVSNGNMYKPTSSNTEITYANKATAQGMNNTGGGDPNQTIMTAGKGTYTFKWNITDKSIVVTYPTSYIMTYGVWYKKASDGNYYSYPSAGSLGASGSVSGDIATGKYAANGETVTFSVGPNSGYSLLGWYSAVTSGTTTATAYVAGSGISIGDGTLALSIGGAKNVYPIVKEHVTTVTVQPNNSDRGTIAVNDVTPVGSSTTTTVGVSTTAKISATAAPGYHFVNWTLASGATLASGSLTDATIYVKGNGTDNSTGTATANFEPIWRIACSIDSYNTTTHPITNITAPAGTMTSGYVDITLAANTDYEFKVYQAGDANPYWGNTANPITQITYSNQATAQSLTHNSGNNQTIHSAAAGSYRFTWDVTNSRITVGYPTSWQITIGQKTIYDPNISPTSDASTTGGNVTAEDNSSNTITSGKYVANSASVTFTAHPAAGYAFKGWYKNADCSTPYAEMSGVTIDEEAKTLTLSSIAADKAVYAKYEEIMSYVSISAYGGTFKVDDGEAISTYGSPYLQVGVKTKHTVTIMSENDGYYFSGWDLHTSEGKVLNTSISGSGEDDRTITVAGLGNASNHILDFLRPEFDFLETIYFRNVFDDGTNPATHWENVYAFFDVTWNDGSHCAVTSAYNSSKGLHVQMEAIGSTGIYRAYVPRYVTRYSKSKVAFMNYDQSTNSAVLNPGGSGAYYGSYRDDYNKLHNMFVPNHVKESNQGYYTDYFNKGYWMHYTISEGENAGYWVEERTAASTYSGKSKAPQFVILNRAYDTDPKIQCRLRIDGTSNKNYAIFSEGGKKYKASSTITYSACDNVTIQEGSGDVYFTITPTAEGEYLLTIDQSGDVMKLSVEYPVVSGDYILENVYNDGTSKTTHSNVIKASDAGTKTRYSMFLSDQGGAATLKLHKCTGFDGSGNPTWNAGDDTNLSDILSDDDFTPGVYQFDLTISADKVSEIDSVRLYTGNFYLKTDAASGGWVAYKNNVMDKNTVNFDRTSKTFDNYWCHYFASKDCNIKCVIANDYCNQLSDTLKQDDESIARMDGGEPYVPIDGTSIRFSYNSATNTIGRAYLGAQDNNDYLDIIPYEEGYIYNRSDVDLYGKYSPTPDYSYLRFTDNGDWVYEIDLKVKPGGKAGVHATYNTSHVQTLIDETENVVLGCQEGSTCTGTYAVRVVYDFKTNYMMSAFVLTDDPITENLSDFDMLWVRHKDESATQLTLGEEKSLKNVRVVGAIEFRYDSVNYYASHSGEGWVDLRYLNDHTRPFMKFFISFPFDVEMNSIFGLNQAIYGRWGNYVIQKYNGATRAKEGLFFGDGDNYWEDVEMGDTLHAYEGYCLIMDEEYLRGDGGSRMWENKSSGSSVYLYFPAMKEIENISNGRLETTVPDHKCNVDRTWTSKISGNTMSHKETDSHWNLIGSPFFHDAYMKDTAQSDTFKLRSFYYLDYYDNKWKAKAVADEPVFKAMSSKYVQWCGTIGWSTAVGDNLLKAPQRKVENKNYLAKLELTFNGRVQDWTYVEMSDGADTAFVLREDMLKMYNSGIPNICTYAGNYDVAYNVVPVETQIVPVGLIIRKNGTYTFSMPSNFSGTVTLIDKFAQTRTNLAIENYVVELQKGTIDDRFELEFNIANAPTAIDGVEDGSGTLKDGKAHKFIMNGQLYILREGKIYDARGAMVK